ncbi:MAG: NIPSNAP family protein [Paracoccaceae bacterium]
MLTCIIKYEIEPTQRADFVQYARNWGQCIARNGAGLIGYYAPHEGSSTLAYGIYNIPDLAAYEQYRARLAADPLGRENYDMAQAKRFIRSEERTFLKCVSLPHGATET